MDEVRVAVLTAMALLLAASPAIAQTGSPALESLFAFSPEQGCRASASFLKAISEIRATNTAAMRQALPVPFREAFEGASLIHVADGFVLSSAWRGSWYGVPVRGLDVVMNREGRPVRVGLVFQASPDNVLKATSRAGLNVVPVTDDSLTATTKIGVATQGRTRLMCAA
jgi:hypothetical protein